MGEGGKRLAAGKCGQLGQLLSLHISTILRNTRRSVYDYTYIINSSLCVFKFKCMHALKLEHTNGTLQHYTAHVHLCKQRMYCELEQAFSHSQWSSSAALITESSTSRNMATCFQSAATSQTMNLLMCSSVGCESMLIGMWPSEEVGPEKTEVV